MCGRLQSLGDSQVGSTGPLCSRDPEHNRMCECVRRAVLAGSVPSVTPLTTPEAHTPARASPEDALHPRLQQCWGWQGA